MARRPDPSLRKAIAEANRRWDAGSKTWFDFLAKDAVVYSINQVKPFLGRVAYQKHFGDALVGGRRKTKTLTQNVQAVSDTGVVAQTLQIVQGNIASNVRQSVIWQKTALNKYGWEIRHLHTALIGQPSAVRTPTGANAVRVLSERIATVAAVLGVAQ